MNTATADQFQAAENDVSAILRAVLPHVPGGRLFDGPPTVTAKVAARLLPAGHLEGICHHANRGPRPVVVTAAEPGVGYCLHCFSHPDVAARVHQHSATTWDCEACGVEVRWFHELAIGAGPMILFANVCGDCMAEAEAAK